MSRSWWTMPKVRVTTEEPSPLPLHTLPPCLFKLSTTYPYTPPSYNWLFSPTLLIYTFFINSSLFLLSRWPKYLDVFFLSIPYITIPLHSICTSSHATSFIHAFVSHSPIISSHILLSNNLFPQHPLLAVMPNSMFESMIHMSMLAGKYCSLNISLPSWTHTFPL